MKWAFIKNKKHVLLTHIIIILAVLGSSEPFDNIDYSPWVMITSLSLLLIYYLICFGIKLNYIPKVYVLIGFCNVLTWVALLFTADYWTNITGWDMLIYLIYPFIAAIFFICQLIINMVVYIIKWIRAKKMPV